MAKSKSRNLVNLNVNPCKMCMPMGAALAFEGVEDSMVLIHGSQGCSTYIRRHIATHFNEPIDIASSSLSEQGTVYGGAANLVQGLKNVAAIYSPKVIGVLTTCLAETIGEDITHIIKESGVASELKGIDIIPVPTPGYAASEYNGYFVALKKIVAFYAREPKVKTNHINVIVTDLTPADIRELKRILSLFEVEYTIFPDISETLDAPYKKGFDIKTEGGTTKSQLRRMSAAIATIEFGWMTPLGLSPGRYLEETFDVPLYSCPLPIGLNGTDLFLEAISKIYDKQIPVELKKARGRMLDAMIDSHKLNREGRAVIYGNPELIYAVSNLCIENGIEPVVIATGTDTNPLVEQLDQQLSRYRYNPIILKDCDFESIQEIAVEQKTNLLIGNSDGKFIKEKEDIPLVRIGFPIHDNIGASRQLYIGYEGSLRFLDLITNTLIDKKHEAYRDKMYNKYFVN
ncbi:MAG: nitrogenase [Firmicutes bacterium HGW-Firmicutes-7]|nr:MAG: nitrogenase [Firmicutes bacterium HGW-Firmicutes-7]